MAIHYARFPLLRDPMGTSHPEKEEMMKSRRILLFPHLNDNGPRHLRRSHEFRILKYRKKSSPPPPALGTQVIVVHMGVRGLQLLVRVAAVVHSVLGHFPH